MRKTLKGNKYSQTQKKILQKLNFFTTYICLQMRDAVEKPPSVGSWGYTKSLTIEHPKQQPCQYASALSQTSAPLPRQARSRTVAPPTPSPWRQNTFHQSSRWSIRLEIILVIIIILSTFSRPAVSSYASSYSSPTNYNRFSSVRSRFF